jgi:hypothetical protein
MGLLATTQAAPFFVIVKTEGPARELLTLAPYHHTESFKWVAALVTHEEDSQYITGSSRKPV